MFFLLTGCYITCGCIVGAINTGDYSVATAQADIITGVPTSCEILQVFLLKQQSQDYLFEDFFLLQELQIFGMVEESLNKQLVVKLPFYLGILLVEVVLEAPWLN